MKMFISDIKYSYVNIVSTHIKATYQAMFTQESRCHSFNPVLWIRNKVPSIEFLPKILGLVPIRGQLMKAFDGTHWNLPFFMPKVSSLLLAWHHLDKHCVHK